MANEIRSTVNVDATKGNIKYTRSRSFNADWTVARMTGGVQAIGFAAHEAIVIGADIATPGMMYVTNLDATNYVEIGVDTTGTFRPFMRLKPGESYQFRLGGSVLPYAKANVASVDLEYNILND